jgi:hypothetical protein
MAAANANVMMKKFKVIGRLLSVVLFSTCMPTFGQSASPAHAYPSGVSVALQIGNDLYDSLDAKYRQKLEAHPLCTMETNAPYMALITTNDANRNLCQISISVGFVDLINHIAHAKAIDKAQPGFFDQYMNGLASMDATTNPPVAPAITADQYWTDDVMNDQASYFNQIMGMTVAINLSHQYLGRFQKYSDRMQGDKCVALNNFLTPSEWDSGVRAAAVNSLNCAFGTEGSKAVFEAIGKMQHRPAWTAYMVPQNTDIKRLNKQLAKYEVDFFHGGLN